MKTKSGFVNILGNPNVGKSTLMNAIVGEKLSIITSKMQTTRHRIKGIVTGEDFQIVYSDTPGILKPAYKLQETMMNYVDGALADADVILYVTDTVEQLDKHNEYLEKIQKTQTPVIIVLNKIDLLPQPQVIELLNRWKELFPDNEIIPISATNKFNTNKIFDLIMEALPEGEFYFPPDVLTDKNERFFVEEIVREKILLHYAKEIPYSVQPIVELFKNEPKILKLRVIIYCSRQSQKGILIGHKGNKLKWVGTDARKDLQEFFEKKVFLELFVKVEKEWREDARKLQDFGYESM